MNGAIGMGSKYPIYMYYELRRPQVHNPSRDSKNETTDKTLAQIPNECDDIFSFAL